MARATNSARVLFDARRAQLVADWARPRTVGHMVGAVVQGDDVTIEIPGVSARSVISGRGSQQDAVVVSERLVGVADGMGGHARGEEASVVALESLVSAAPRHCTVAGLVDAVGAAHGAVAALADGEFRNPGSTLVAVAVSDDNQFVHGVWCGDSRAWVIDRTGSVTSATIDHAHHTGGLFACLGAHDETISGDADSFSVPVGGGFKILLSSDGVHGWMGRTNTSDDSGELAALISQGVAELVATAVTRDTDNATAVLVDVDRWVGATAAQRPPRRWQVLRRVQRGEWESWIPGVDVRGVGGTAADSDAALAAKLPRWARPRIRGAHAELAEAVNRGDGDVATVLALLET